MQSNNCISKDDILSEFRDLINSEPLHSILTNDKDFSSLYMLICSFLHVAKINLEIIEKDIEDEKQFVTFLLHSSVLKESIKQLEKQIKEIDKDFKLQKQNKKLFYESWKKFWFEFVNILQNEFTKEMDDAISNDDNFFEYIRSLCCAHPLNTSRHPKLSGKNPFHDYLKYQALNSISTKRSLSANLSNLPEKKFNSPTLIIINSLDATTIDSLKSLHLSFDFDCLKEYIENYYKSCMTQILQWFKKVEQEFIKSQKEKEYSWSDDNLELINQIIKELDNKYLSSQNIDFYELKDEYIFFKSDKLIHAENTDAINKYFDEIFNIIRNEILPLIENYDYNNDNSEWELQQAIAQLHKLDTNYKDYSFCIKELRHCLGNPKGYKSLKYIGKK